MSRELTLVGLEGEVVLQLELHPLRSLGEGCEASSPQSPTLASLTTLEEQQAPDGGGSGGGPGAAAAASSARGTGQLCLYST